MNPINPTTTTSFHFVLMILWSSSAPARKVRKTAPAEARVNHSRLLPRELTPKYLFAIACYFYSNL